MVDADLLLRRDSETLKHVYSSKDRIRRVDSTMKRVGRPAVRAADAGPRLAPLRVILVEDGSTGRRGGFQTICSN